MEVFKWLPVGNPQCVVKQRVLKAQFGDGYIQAMGDGINNALQTWTLEFAGSRIDEINTFLLKHQGFNSFQWKTPEGVTAVFMCNGFSRKYYGNRIKSISASFEQVFKP